jgi:RNA polymerase sigma factor (sigma-70 family)
MFPLLGRCLANDRNAWESLWLIYDHCAARPVRRLLVDAGFHAADADDVAQEIYVALRKDRCERLRSFQGESGVRFCTWLRHVAMNLTRDWIKKRHRAIRREREALKQLANDDHLGATEHDVETLIEEFGGALTYQERADLRAIIELGGQPTRAESGRTRRRKRKAIEDKARKFLGVPARRKSRRSKNNRTK